MTEKNETRFLRNAQLAKFLGVAPMTIWRFQRDPKLNFPKPARINNIDYTSIDEVQAWLKARVVDHAVARAARGAARGARS